MGGDVLPEQRVEQVPPDTEKMKNAGCVPVVVRGMERSSLNLGKRQR
jgi:hypothetical protein